MKIEKIRSQVLTLALFAAAAMGCGNPYVTATGKYADAMSASATTLRSGGQLAGEMCDEQAYFIFLQAKMQIAPGGEITWSKWHTTENVAGTKTTWRDYCNKVRDASAAFGEALGVLEAYAGAMKGLAQQADYDGADVQALAGSVSQLAGDTPFGKVVGGLGEPLAKLSGVLVSKYTTGQIKDFAVEADPHVVKILDGADAFVKALEHDLGDLERLPGPSFDALERVSFPPATNIMQHCRGQGFDPDQCKIDPLQARTYMEWSRAVSSQMADRRSAIVGLQGAIKALRATQKKFVAAAPSEVGVKEVLGAVSETLTQIANVRDALASTKGE